MAIVPKNLGEKGTANEKIKLMLVFLLLLLLLLCCWEILKM